MVRLSHPGTGRRAGASDRRTPPIRGGSRSSKDRIMPLRRTVTRSLVTVGAAHRPRRRVRRRHVVRGAGGGAEPVAPAAAPGSDASPAAYTGSDLSLAGSCDDLLAWYVERGVDRVGPYGWDSATYAVLRRSRTACCPQARPTRVQPPSRDVAAAGARAGPRDQRGDRHQRAGGRRRRAGRRQDRRPHAVPGRGRRPGHLRRHRRRGRPARLGRPARPSADAEILLAGDTVVAIAQRGDPAAGPTAPSPTSTEVVTLDVSDPAAPEVDPHRRVRLRAGHRPAARRRGPAGARRPGCPTSTSSSRDRHTTEWEATQANAGLVRDSAIEDWLPTPPSTAARPSSSSTATRSRSPTTARRSAPSPWSASTHPRPRRRR